ncbi:FAD-dependent oxidoreductase [Alkalibacillus haloalkaliphilus]|uniref:FAD-dependent oxidoreductase n=1 Tax=Alkalibacillus haloalkaliphilus TaxID=94136 RepID=UPI0029360750|nr:FAD-dependent oxidoreductase [Alkalibacillus haloalkaliphilus]MDV2581832.1 FAD-dependent oxidoreductase [Alkalibacillus haloalkaliphilus]
MNIDGLPEESVPVWKESMEKYQLETLQGDHKTDVVIVGGGITGITAAYLLAKSGKEITLIDAGHLVQGTTLHTTAKVTAQHNLIYDELLSHFNYQIARGYYEANKDAMNLFEQIIQDEQIECDWETHDAYLYSTSGEYGKKIEDEYKAYQNLNINGKITDSIPFNIEIENALYMKDQYQFNPTKYLNQLIQIIQDKGVKLYENTVAVNVESTEQSATVITREGHKIEGKYVLSCTHFPFYEGKGLYSGKIHAQRSYVIAFPNQNPYPGGMYLSVDEPSRTIRHATINNQDYILFGGESHKVGQGKDLHKHYLNLKRSAEEIFGKVPIEYRWSTQDLVTLDKLPYVGPVTKDEPRVLIATGYRKWGMTNSTAAAKLMADTVLGNSNPYEEVYKPSRFNADPSLKKFFTENFDLTKHLVKGKLEFPKNEVEDLKQGEATTFLMNGQRKGAYKHDDETVYIVDTTCTHAGCEVNWNDAENTWDCPCHGSRYSYKGEVIEGPAEKDLKNYDFRMLDILKDDESGY